MLRIIVTILTVSVLLACEFAENVSSVHKELTTNKLGTYTMAPRNKYQKVYKLTRGNKTPKRFDIIEFQHNDEFFDDGDFYSSNEHVSRVVGLPNETIEIKQGQVYINDRKLDQPFLVDSCLSNDNFPKSTVTNDCYFVMVDNRKMIHLDSVPDVRYKPYDSRIIGSVHKSKILGITDLK